MPASPTDGCGRRRSPPSPSGTGCSPQTSRGTATLRSRLDRSRTSPRSWASSTSRASRPPRFVGASFGGRVALGGGDGPPGPGDRAGPALPGPARGRSHGGVRRLRRGGGDASSRPGTSTARSPSTSTPGSDPTPTTTPGGCSPRCSDGHSRSRSRPTSGPTRPPSCTTRSTCRASPCPPRSSWARSTSTGSRRRLVEVAAAVPGATLVELDWAGHLPGMERPAEISALVLAALGTAHLRDVASTHTGSSRSMGGHDMSRTEGAA